MRKGTLVLGMLGALLTGYSSAGETVLYDDLEPRGNVIYHNEEPYTGIFLDKDSQGRVRAQGHLEAGLLQGEVITYDIYGKVMKSVSYVNGKPDGISTTFYEDGSIEEKGRYEAGEPEGKWVSYYQGGAIERISYLKNGYPEGEWTFFNEDGSVKEKRTYKNGQRQ